MKFGMDQHTIENIRKIIDSHASVDTVIIYGSRAKGTFKKGSDIDLVLKGNVSFSEILLIETQLDTLMLPYKIDISSYNSIENQELIDHIDRIGKQFI